MPEEQNPSQQPAKKARVPQVTAEQTIGSYKSYWPLALAVALFILLIGVITNPIVLAIGGVLTAVAIIGWGLEKR